MATDRLQKLLGKKWEWLPQGSSFYLLVNRMPRTAYGVTVRTDAEGRSAIPSPTVQLC